MNYYRLLTTGDLSDEDQFFIEDGPEDMGIYSYRLTFGESAIYYFPDNAVLSIRKENMGKDLGDIIGNSKGYFIGSEKVKNIISEIYSANEIEFFPFTLYSYKGDIISKRYYFINPLELIDCMNSNMSSIIYDEKDNIISIKKLVLDNSKLNGSIDLFRLKELPNQYILSQKLADLFVKHEVKNFIAERLVVY